MTTPGLGACISGAILYDETIRQQKKDGTFFVKIIIEAGIIPVQASTRRNWINWRSTRFVSCPWMPLKRPIAATPGCPAVLRHILEEAQTIVNDALAAFPQQPGIRPKNNMKVKP